MRKHNAKFTDAAMKEFVATAMASVTQEFCEKLFASVSIQCQMFTKYILSIMQKF